MRITPRRLVGRTVSGIYRVPDIRSRDVEVIAARLSDMSADSIAN